ncbi:prolyl oligopeptidase family serine peptidase [Alteribacter natronophilus]|uniref:carboxylesterase family protein n=1 Tax=Alteribacter natronophilus TaxID=2583810 RepID=UPI00110E80B2|nr:prolyl oligopeptidase family serine peptidase [Alteribacter natronophilus]TMW70296.1 phospholipase [Alteribacter natronophilus]
MQKHVHVEKTFKKEMTFRYVVDFPEQYGETEENYPLILFLHGMGQRGESFEDMKVYGMPKLAAERNIPAVIVSPVCPETTTWIEELDALHSLVIHAAREYRVDPERIYLTGLSMGGFGAWHLAEKYPYLFAALAPICGGALHEFGFLDRIHRIAHMPVWTFHGAKDDVVPIERTQVLVDRLRKDGGNVEFTVYPEAGHDSWTETYDDPRFLDWLLRQRNPEVDFYRKG